MKEYIGDVNTREVTVITRSDVGGTVRPLEHHVRHSPDGFAWGYGGSGPSELARCILLDHFSSLDPPEREERVEPVYQDFKFSLIAPMAQDEDFKLTSFDIERWFEAHAGSRRS
jgi:hypothetical protein